MESLDDDAFPYEPLDTSKSMIRLLNVSSLGGMIFASLQNWSLDSPDRPPFSTVSYTWGPQSHSNFIEIEGRKFPVLDQLYPFLRLVCDGHHSLSTEFWWWIDSICINQRDHIERSQQVQLMKRVYSGATRTIVWLGEQSTSSAEAIEFLRTLCERTRNHQITKQDIQRLRESAFRGKWSAVESLFQRPWWTRVWTLQEFVIPQRLRFYCGSQSFSRNTLRDMLVGIWLCEHTGRVADMVLLSYYSAWNRRRLLEWFLFRNKTVADERTSLRLVAIMAYLGDCDATDPRDHVYSVLGLADDHTMVGPPDYKRSVRDVYTCLVISFLDFYKSLDIICFAHLFHRQACDSKTDFNLPSWVPDWTVKVRPEVVPLLVSQSAGRHISNFRPHHSLGWTVSYMACGENPPSVEFPADSSAMTCSGIMVDEIDGLCMLLDEFAARAGSSGCPFIHSTSQANFRQRSQTWSPKMWDTASFNSNPPEGDSSSPATAQPTFADSDPSDIDFSDDDIDLSQIGWAELETLVIANGTPSPRDSSDSDMKIIVEAISQSLVLGRTDKYLRNAAPVTEDLHTFLNLCRAVQEGNDTVNPIFRQWYEHNKFLSIDGYTIEGLTTRTTDRGPTAALVDLEDGTEATSFLARFHNSTRTLERRLAVTAQGHVGMAPSRAQKHDLICVLFGCSVPVVLRPRDDGLSYQFVGEMYLHGFMNGEAVDQARQEKLDIQKFTLF